jgi:hypothetical protein
MMKFARLLPATATTFAAIGLQPNSSTPMAVIARFPAIDVAPVVT